MSEYIKKQKILYKSFKYYFCSALQENIYFNSTGLSHLLYKKRRPRSKKEQYYRASTIKHLINVISNSTHADKKIMSHNPKIIMWALFHECLDDDNKRVIIKVILKKEGLGKIYFLSAMKKKIFKQTKNPKPIKVWDFL